MMKRLLLMMVLCFLTCCGERTVVITDHTDGYKGKAKLNPYLAAQELLRDTHEGEVKVRNGFVKYDYEVAMVVSPASALSSEFMVDKMLNWVSDGGVYVCLLQRGDKYWVDVGEGCDHDTDSWDDSWKVDNESREAKLYLLEKMDVRLVDEPSGKTTGGDHYYSKPKDPVVLGDELPLVEDVYIPIDDYSDKKLHLKIGGTHVIEYDGELSDDDLYQEGDYHRFLGLQHGAGKIYFITESRLFRNAYIGMNDHAEMLELMKDDSYDSYGEIIFCYGNRRGFWSLMGNYAGPALLGVFFLLVFWLWKNIPRFGPLLEIREGHARDYAQAVSNTGRFLWTYKGAYVLLTAMRDNLFRASGMFNSEGDSDELLIESFAEKSGLGVEEVIEAISRKGINDAGDMVRVTKNLQTILKSL